MTGTFHVKNYEKFQHYADRTPPWIKLYNELLDNYEFGLLPDSSKAHLVAIWLLASRSKNKIPLDPKWVAKRISASEPVDLTILRNSGFIEFDQPCSDVLADCKQDARPEEKRVEENRKELSANADDGFQEFWKNYPTDRNMSRKAALSQWRKLSAGKRAAAIAALPGFKAYCAANSWYRPKHAEGWLSQERFEGYAADNTQGGFKNTDERGWRDRVRLFEEKGLWSTDWGPKPGEAGCKCPPDILSAEKAA